MSAEFAIDLDPGPIEDENGVDCVVLSLSTDQVYCMIRIARADLGRFEEAGRRRWVDGSVPIGRCAGSNAFWSTAEDGRLALVVGCDDQTWDVSLTMPSGTLDRIIAAVRGLDRSAR